MRATLSLFRREFLAGFLSPIAYVVLVVFLLLTGILFTLVLRLLTAEGPRGVEFPMQVMKLWLVFLFLPPVLTMRLFAEEKSSNTIEMLMTAPLRDWQIVFSKFLACYAFFLVLLIPTWLYLPIVLGVQVVHGPNWNLSALLTLAGLVACGLGPVWAIVSAGGWLRIIGGFLTLLGLLTTTAGIILRIFVESAPLVIVRSPFGDPSADATAFLALETAVDPNPVLASYVGLALAGAMFLSIGLFVSSLVRSQIVAFLIALAVSLLFMLDFLVDLVAAAFGFGLLGASTSGSLVPTYFSVPVHFTRDLARGVVDTRPAVLYLSVTLFCLYLTVRSLESQRWR